LVLGRKLFLLTIALGSIILFCETIIQGDLAGAWGTFGVPAISPTFADVRTITHSIECKENGHNPYLTGECDPWGRRYNYPPIWLELGKFSIGPATTNIVGLFVASLFLFTLLILTNLFRWPSAVIMVLASLSPPILLGLERGNTDLVIFSLVCFLFYLSDPASRSYSTVIGVGVVLLTALKVYPVALAASLIKSRRDILLAVLVSLIAATVLILHLGDQGIYFVANQQAPIERAFGSSVLPRRLTNLPSRMVLRMLSTTFAACIGLFVLWFAFRYKRLSAFLPTLENKDSVGRVAIACNFVFVFSFLLQANFDYRLVFLLPLVLLSLQQFENSFDHRKLWFPALIVLYLWLVPLNSWIIDVLSLFIFLVVFTANGIVLLRAVAGAQNLKVG
jgi:hypothetical protein